MNCYIICFDKHTHAQTNNTQMPSLCPSLLRCVSSEMFSHCLLHPLPQENAYQFVLNGRAWEAGMYAATVLDSAPSHPVESLYSPEETQGVCVHPAACLSM